MQVLDVSDIADDERTAILVLLESIGVELTQVGEVTEGEGGVADGNVNGKELTKGEGVARVCCPYVMVVVATVEDVVITLSVLRHKGCTKQGQMGLIVKSESLTLNLEAIVGTDEGGKCDACMRLSRIVAVSVVIEESQIAASKTASREVEARQEHIGPLPSPSCIVSNVSANVVGVFSRTVGRGEIALRQCHEQDVGIAPKCATCFVKVCELRSFVFEWRQIGVEVVHPADTEEGGVKTFPIPPL